VEVRNPAPYNKGTTQTERLRDQDTEKISGSKKKKQTDGENGKMGDFVICNPDQLIFLFLPQQPNAGQDRLILEVPRSHTTVGRTPLDEGSARRRDLYLTTNKTHDRQTSMLPLGRWHRRPNIITVNKLRTIRLGGGGGGRHVRRPNGNRNAYRLG
jgi:hypothetical protein